MSRLAKWKLEKTKVKVVFRLQFHATHVPQAGWDKLFISFIPADSGKPTAKTTKANVRNGTCKWADPIYETTRLLQDTRTKQFDEKLYKIIVAMGTSRSSLLGEAIINLAEFADALKPSVVAFPLQGCDSGAILHVTVQLLTSKTGFREFEQQREIRERGLSTTSDISSPDESSRTRIPSSDETANDHMDKMNPRVRFKDMLQDDPALEEAVVPNEGYPDSAAGFDGASNTSESLYAEKHELSSANEIDSVKSVVSGDLGGLALSPQKQKGTSEWVHCWGSDYLGDNNDYGNAMEENIRLKGCLEAAESSINELKREVSSLQHHADEIGSKAQKFSQLLISEISSGDRLVSEVSVLKSQCLKLKEEVEELRNIKSCTSFNSKDVDTAFHDMQLRWLQGLLVVEDKVNELQNKASYGYHDRDLRLFLSDLEALLGALVDLRKRIGKPTSPLSSVPSETTATKEKKEIGMHKTKQFVSVTELDTDIYHPELGPLHYLSTPSCLSRESNSVDSANAMKEKIFELLRELDESKVERGSLTKKMDQMECYYESLVQELEETQRQLLGELQNLRTEHSSCLYTVSSTKAEMETLRQDMNEQILRFSKEKQALDSLNKELEKRAMASEAALKRARLNYSIAVNHLQKDLELLSSQVVSMFETNENLIKRAFPDPSQQSLHEYPQTKNSELEKHEKYDAKFLRFQNEKMGMKEQSLGGDILLEDLKRSLHVQEGLYKKVEDELCEMHSMNVYLEVFSKILQEILVDTSVDRRIMKEKVDELAWQLELSTEAKELLKQRLDIALDEVCSLNEDKATCISKWNDVALQNQSLEANIQNITHENLLLLQKIDEMESVVLEYRSYQSKYEMCSVEKTELANMLEKEAREKVDLQTSISTLEVELDNMRSKFNDVGTANEDLQNNLNGLKNRLKDMLGSYSGRVTCLSLWDGTMDIDLDSHDLVEQLQKFLCKMCEKTFLLLTENRDLIEEKGETEASLGAAESDITWIKRKYEHDVQCLVAKLEDSSAFLQRLQSESESIAEKVKVISEAEQNYENRHKEFLSSLDCLEDEMQLLVSKNEILGREISELGSLADENGKSKLIVVELEEEKHNLLVSLQGKSQETSRVALELENLRKTYYQELKLEKSSRQELESQVQHLISELNEKHAILLSFDEHNSELVRLKQMVSDLEAEKSACSHLLSRYEESLRSSHRDSLYISDLESQLTGVVEFSVAADIQIVFMRTEWEGYVEELHEKHLEVERALTESLAVRANYVDENSKLLTDLNSLRSELKVERNLRDKLQSGIEELSSELNEKHLLLQSSDEQKSQLAVLEKMVSELESEKLSQNHIFSKYEECVSNAQHESSFIDNTFEYSIAADVELIFTRTQMGIYIYDLAEQLSCSCSSISEFQKKHMDMESVLNRCLANEAKYREENNQLLESLEVLKSELKSSVAKSRALVDTSDAMKVELEECRTRAENAERSYSEDKSRYACEVERLKALLARHEEEMENLMVLKTEVEVSVEVLKDKVAEQHGRDADELVMLKTRCSELTQKLSEQVLKTEEFKNLSIHLKELKDKAEAECTHAREKSEYQAPLTPQQESLRIIFIKEQYETKLQELKHQLSMSKKHSEEMLMKLQDAIDEIEARKKAEASHLKKNEELKGKILELEAKLQSAVYDKREKTTAYDMMKAELDCSLLSLECCKEEKQKLEASLQEHEREKSKMTQEIESMRALVESSSSSKDFQMQGHYRLKTEDHILDQLSGRSIDNKNLVTAPSGVLANHKERESLRAVAEQSDSPGSTIQDSDLSGSTNEDGNQLPSKEMMALNNGEKNLALINDNFKAENLRSSLDHFNNELERMKNENLLLPPDDNDSDTRFPDLERELMQLRKAKEELRSMFSLSNEHLGCRNALERVLALEIELAEALRGKNRSTINFQSSFLKQHSNDEAIFQSFRDINDLIEELLEMKGRYASMETELKEMHERYSQLSLQFAEVEGERQKLSMTLKNVRSSKKALPLNRSSSATLGDHS